jgi:putative membrane protein
MNLKSFIVGTVATAIAFFLLARALPQFVKYDGELVGLLGIAVIFGVVNGLIGPIVKLLALPISFMTMGAVGFVINGGLLLATAWLATQVGLDLSVGGFPAKFTADTVVAAVVGAIALSLISTIVGMVVRD